MADRRQVLSFRAHAQQLDRAHNTVDKTVALDIGVQDTGPDGSLWALALRGVDVKSLPSKDLVMLWSIRGAPHLYRRSDIAQVAAAAEPFSEDDAAKRIFDAAKPLKAAGIGIREALDEIGAKMRGIVTKPIVKGEVSTQLTKVMPEPYLRFCRPCNAIHLYEQTFRLGATQGGLELQPGTSPPVLQRIPKFKRATSPHPRFDLIRLYLRLLGPATHKHVADYLDAPVSDVKSRWPEDVTEVQVGREKRWMLAEDEETLETAEVNVTRLLGPYDLFLQAKDRPTLVPDSARAKELWPVLGRPGAILVDGDFAGTWRPRQSGKSFTLAVQPWRKFPAATRKAVEQEAEHLATFRNVNLTGVDFSD